MVEFETLGIVSIIVGLISYQIKLSNKHLHEKIDNETEKAIEAHNHINASIQKINDKIGVI